MYLFVNLLHLQYTSQFAICCIKSSKNGFLMNQISLSLSLSLSLSHALDGGVLSFLYSL